MLKISILTIALTTASLSTTQNNSTSPVIISDKSIFTVENKKFITKINADAKTKLTYEIISGVDKDKFTIDDKSGELYFKENANFESPTDSNKNNTYNVTIKITNTKQESYKKDFAITVLDMVEI